MNKKKNSGTSLSKQTNLHLRIEPELKEQLQIIIVKRKSSLQQELEPLIRAYIKQIEKQTA